MRWVKPAHWTTGWDYEVQPASERHGIGPFPDCVLFLFRDETATSRTGS